MPLILEFIKIVIKRWQFWALLIALLALGVALRHVLSAQQHALVCDWYKTYFATGVRKQIGKVVSAETPATNPASTTSTSEALADRLARHIEEYFCQRDQPDTQEVGINITLRECVTIIPGSVIIAFLIVSLLPQPPKKGELQARMNQAESIRLLAAVQGNQTVPVSGALAAMSRSYPDAALSARQLRIAATYALISALLTFAFPPTYTGQISGVLASGNVAHLCAIAAAAFAVALYAAYPFSSSPFKTSQLAWKLGFGPIFFAGMIATAISLPYQVLRPPELRPMTREQVMLIVAIRCFSMPLVAAIAVVLFRRSLRALPAL